MSIDDPNFFAKNGTGNFSNFGPQDTEQLPFECDPTVGPNTTHSYTLSTLGTNSKSMTITITKPTNP